MASSKTQKFTGCKTKLNVCALHKLSQGKLPDHHRTKPQRIGAIFCAKKTIVTANSSSKAQTSAPERDALCLVVRNRVLYIVPTWQTNCFGPLQRQLKFILVRDQSRPAIIRDERVEKSRLKSQWWCPSKCVESTWIRTLMLPSFTVKFFISVPVSVKLAN